jgi:predicted Rossmann fold nucleotide-binding protein DprA/Smf involved in DNA uptake
LTAAETGLLLLCCALPEAEDRPLTMAQFQELAKRARALGPGGENPLRELTARDLERLGYSQEQCGRIVRLLSRETQLERYLRAAERNGIVPITRLSPRYPARLRQTLGQRCPAVLFAKGDEALLAARCISVVGSRELTEGGRAFAEAAGRLIARSGYALCSGGAMGADRAAQEACLTAGGSAVVFPAGRLLDCPAQAHVLYLAEQGYDLPFSAQRALSRNHFIHAMGEKTLVAQCRAGAGGTWDGTTENLRRGWSPVFVSDDGSEGAQALIARGAVPVRTLSGLDDLQPAQLQF